MPETILLLYDIWMRRASSCIISICQGGCCHLPDLLGTVGDDQGLSTRGIHPGNYPAAAMPASASVQTRLQKQEY